VFLLCDEILELIINSLAEKVIVFFNKATSLSHKGNPIVHLKFTVEIKTDLNSFDKTAGLQHGLEVSFLTLLQV